VQDKYNYEGVNFPASYDNIENIQDNNKVCVVVFTTKNENEDTIIVKEMLGNPDYFINDNGNLLRITDVDEDGVSNSHYVYI
jgi:hypothetical protein